MVGFGDLVRGFGLADLLDDFAILDLADDLAAAHAIAELDVDMVVSRPPGFRRHIDGRFANQVADDAEMCARCCRATLWSLRRSSAAGNRRQVRRSRHRPVRHAGTAAARPPPCRAPGPPCPACAWPAAAAGCSRLHEPEIRRRRRRRRPRVR